MPKNRGDLLEVTDTVLKSVRHRHIGNVDRWGHQRVEILHHAVQEELGEWSRAVLEREGAAREFEELVDAIAVLVELAVDAYYRTRAYRQSVTTTEEAAGG